MALSRLSFSQRSHREPPPITRGTQCCRAFVFRQPAQAHEPPQVHVLNFHRLAVAFFARLDAGRIRPFCIFACRVIRGCRRG
jgi:hypothetical protein